MNRIHHPIFKIFLNRDTTACLWLIFICILAYGLLIPVLGFYWDDLPYLYLYRTLGAHGFPKFVSSDRPFSAWIFMLTTSLFKYQAIWYHLLILLLRMICVFLFFHLMKLIWPKQHNQNIISASIFAIYPGFLQQPIALIYIHHFSVLAIFLLSLNLMVFIAKSEKNKPFIHLISILASFHLFSIENFALLELLRPILLWLTTKIKNPNKTSRLKIILRVWFPYLIVFCLFLVWRVFIFKFPTYKPDFLLEPDQSLVAGILRIIKRIPADFHVVMIDAWLKPFFIPVISEFGTLATYFFWILLGFSIILNFCILHFLTNLDKSEDIGYRHCNDLVKNQIWERLFLGICAFFLSALIVWVLDLPLQIEFAWDRMTIGFIPAVALIGGAVYGLLKKWPIAINLVYAILLSTAIASHYENGMTFKRDWEHLNDLFHQLAWRAPQLEEGTILLTSEIDLRYYSDNSLTAPLNMIYSPESNSESLKYLFYHTDVRLGTKLPSLEKNLEIYQQYRNFYFKGNTSNILALKFDPPGCLQIMDRTYANSIVLPNLSDQQVDEIAISNVDQIQYSHPYGGLHLPKDILVPSQEQTWCYYFEKADLARQYKQYDKAAELGDEAIENKLSPRIGTEWLPFLESYIFTSNWSKAEYVAKEMIANEENLKSGLCYTLLRINNQPDFYEKDEIEILLKDYNCLQNSK